MADKTRIQRVRTALKEWYRETAGGRVGGGICDDCNSSLKPGETYLRPGGHLCCESCTDALLNADYIDWDQALENLNSCFGPGVPKRIQDAAAAQGKIALVQGEPSESRQRFRLHHVFLAALILIGSVTLAVMATFVHRSYGITAMWVFLLLCQIVPALINYRLAGRRARSGIAWMLWGVFFSYPATIILLCLGSKSTHRGPRSEGVADEASRAIREGKVSAHPSASVILATTTAKVSTLRLADPAHPAHKQLEQAVEILDQYVQVELAGDRTAMKVSAPVGEMEKALSSLNEAVAICPDDMDLLVAKACVLHASAQFKSAEEVIDLVLSKVPDHFEAKLWKSHWETWSDALRFPRWDERLSSLHPVMASHLRLDHRVQIVRDGIQKTLAIVTGIEGPPFDSRTRIKVEWVLSRTPYGPLVAYYPKIIEPSGEPSTMEAFLPIFQPTLFSPMEGYFLIQQLAFTPYCFVVLVSGATVALNRRIVFGQKTVQIIRDMASQLTSTQSYLPKQQLKTAAQWHMHNFDMTRLTFE